MKKHEEGWGWMLAVDFFFAGMGGAMLAITGIMDLFVGEGRTSVLGNFLAPVFMSIGSGLLILELGRPFQAWRVFLNPRAILTVGAWIMTIAIGAGFVYTSFAFDLFPWSNWGWARKLVALAAFATGLIVATYPGILLGRHKGRPFWVGPGMTSLFLLSSIVTGFSAHTISAFVVPVATLSDQIRTFPSIIGVLLTLQALLWFSYIWVKSSGSTAPEAEAARRWIKGDLSVYFLVGIILIGTIVPLILVLFSSPEMQMLGAVMVLVGGVTLRMLVVKAGEDRTWLPGEKKYRSRLPKGDEAFLRAWGK